MTTATRQQIMDAYIKMATDRIGDGWEAYLLTFMFNQLAGSPTAIAQQMDREVEIIYAKMLTRIVRNPRATRNLERLPVWIVAPDWPVAKTDKDHFRDIALNDGSHRHAAALIPPSSRLMEPLADHIDDCQTLYSGADRALFRLHAIPIVRTPEKALGYALKSLKRGSIDAGDVWVLPRSISELPNHRHLGT